MSSYKMKVFLIIVTVMILSGYLKSALAAPSVTDNRLDDPSDIHDSWPRIAKILGNCIENEDMPTCLAIKGITAMNRAARTNKIEIIPGITFIRSEVQHHSTLSSLRNSRSVSENEILSTLPNNAEDKNEKLLEMAVESAADFLTSHNLEVKMPTDAAQEVARAIDEGRGKMKKLMGPLMMALGAKLIAVVPLLLGGLALVATKALVVAKIAFILAIVLGAAKLLGGGSSVLGKLSGAGQGVGWPGQGTGWSNVGGAQGWAGGNPAYPYARSLDAQELAYKEQMPLVKNE